MTPEEKLLSERLQYTDLKDKGYRKPLSFFMTCLLCSVILYIVYLNTVAFFVLLTGLIVAPAWYIFKKRYCLCQREMARFAYDTEVYFYCDRCRTKIKSLIGLDAGTSD